MAAALPLVLGVTVAAHARPLTKHTPIDVKGRQLASLHFANLVIRADVLDDVGVAKDEYVLTLVEELRSRGFPVLGAESLVFSKDNSAKAPFSLGGTLTEIRCDELVPKTCGVVIRWELLDRRTEKVVYQVETRHEEDQLDGSFSKQSAKDLLVGALRSLLSRESFVKALEEAPSASSTEETRYLPKTIQQCPERSASLPKDSEQVLASTVVVRAGDSLGSGFLISPDGLVLTAAHVVGESDVNVTLRDGTKHAARTVRVDTKHDVALLQLTTKQTPCLPTRMTPALAGEDIYAIGSPAGEALSFSISRGIVSGTREFDGVRFLQTDATINPGNSGGPLVDAQGNAVAIVSWKLTGPDLNGLGFGVPVAAAFQRLAVTPGDHTDGELGAAQGVALAKPSARIVTDTPDPGWQKVDLPKPQLVAWVRPVRTASYIAAGAGIAFALFSYTKFSGEFPRTRETYDNMRPYNDVGWALFGLGAAGVTASYLLQTYETPPRKHAGSRTKVTASVGAGFASLKVVY